jgi:membrane protease YdiL (CAAX protease family)
MEPNVTSQDGVANDRDATANPLPKAAQWGFWATVLWGIVIFALYAAVQIGTTLAIADWSPANPADRSFGELIDSGLNKGYSLSLATLLTAIVCCGAIVVIVRLRENAIVPEYLGLTPVAPMTLLKWIGLFVVVSLAADFGLMWLDDPTGRDFMSDIYKNAKPAWLLWPALIVAGPLFEELFVRGFLLPGFAASFMRPVGAVIVTSALWAAIHLQYDAFGIAVVFCIGLLLGAARIRTGSLIVPLTLHALQNLMATVAVIIPD